MDLSPGLTPTLPARPDRQHHHARVNSAGPVPAGRRAAPVHPWWTTCHQGVRSTIAVSGKEPPMAGTSRSAKGTRKITGVVIVGAGFAGIACAKRLAAEPRAHVTLLDGRGYHQFQPLLYQV